MRAEVTEPSLLAVDLGLKTGLALFADTGKLVWYRSHNFGTTERLRRAVHGILNGIPGLATLVIEGGGNLAVVWEKEAKQRGIAVYRVDAAICVRYSSSRVNNGQELTRRSTQSRWHEGSSTGRGQLAPHPSGMMRQRQF